MQLPVHLRRLPGSLHRDGALKISRFFPNPLPIDGSTMTSGNDWIYTGRIEYRKGVHTLIEAYARLCESQTPPKLRIIGRPYGKLPDGEEYSEYIEQLIIRKGCQSKIEWVRGVPLSSIQGYLQRSNVAIFPSIWENLSYGCLEAMANGLAWLRHDAADFPKSSMMKKMAFCLNRKMSLS